MQSLTVGNDHTDAPKGGQGLFRHRDCLSAADVRHAGLYNQQHVIKAVLKFDSKARLCSSATISCMWMKAATTA